MKEGQCLKCKQYIVIDTTISTGRMQPFCSECQEGFERKIASGRVGKKIKGKKRVIITPPIPE